MYYILIRPAIRKMYYLFASFSLGAVSLLLFWIRRKKIDNSKTKAILLIKLERIGDLVLSLPAIRKIRSYFPESKIYMVATSYTKDIVEASPYIDELLVYDKAVSLKDKVSFIRMLRKYCFDLAIDLTTRNFMFLPVWILGFSKAKVTVGLNNYGRAFLYNIKVKPYPGVEIYGKEVMHILEPLGIKSDDYKPKLFLSKSNEEFIHMFFKERNINETVIKVVIHPGGYYDALRWEEEKYAEVTERILSNYKAAVFFVGSKREVSLIEKIVSWAGDSKNILNMAGRLSLGESMALIARANLFIGNSSGPLHIACGFDIPTISFLGPSIPERWRPQGEKNIVFRGKLSSKDYDIEYSQVKDYKQLKPITVKMVREAVDKILSKE